MKPKRPRHASRNNIKLYKARASGIIGQTARPTDPQNLAPQICPPMTRAEWLQLPESVRYFHPWPRARKPLVISKPKVSKGYKRWQLDI